MQRNRIGTGKQGRERRKTAAFDQAVQNKMGLAGWIRQPNGHTGGTVAQAAAESENQARAAMKARDLPKAKRLIGKALGQRMQELTPQAAQAVMPQGKAAAQKQTRNHQRAVGRLRGVQQAIGDVASSYFHESRKIDGTWPPKGGRKPR